MAETSNAVYCEGYLTGSERVALVRAIIGIKSEMRETRLSKARLVEDLGLKPLADKIDNSKTDLEELTDEVEHRFVTATKGGASTRSALVAAMNMVLDTVDPFRAERKDAEAHPVRVKKDDLRWLLSKMEKQTTDPLDDLKLAAIEGRLQDMIERGRVPLPGETAAPAAAVDGPAAG